ncbi:TetR/AcrR family transcriptional regulator [Zhongshania sp.]|uniref:TetR/AcrR family transcriptional regulator n=1 Tax=Zhongshania sp. TaxID=1971902 RepID=UPI00356A6560
MPDSKLLKNETSRSRGRPKLEDVADIEKTILDVALKEFLTQGYGGASVSKIVRDAGVSKTTVYSRFASKEALFHAIMETQLESLAPADLLISPTGGHSLEEGLRNYANRMLEVSLEGPMLGVNRLMYSESHRFPELGAAAAKRTQLGVKRISRFINDCATAQGISCNDPETAAEVFILAIRGWFIDAMLTNRKVTSKQRKEWVDKAIRVLMASSNTW